MKILKEAKTIIFQDSSTNKLYRYNPEDGKYYELNIDHSNSSNSSGQSIKLPNSKNKSADSSDEEKETSSNKGNSEEGEENSSDQKSSKQKSSSGKGTNDEKENSSSSASKDSTENSSSQDSNDRQDSKDNRESNKPLRIGDKGNKAKERSRKWDEEETEEQKQERLQRVSQIKRLMDNPDFVISAVADAQRVVKKKREKASSKGSITIKNINEFQPSLNRFIKSQITKKRGYSYAKPNKKYNPEDILKPGRTRAQQTKIPRINVYFDVSVSWGPGDIELGKYYISILNGYEQQKKIIVDLYYFANRVSKNPSECGGGTKGQPILDHIVETGPDNVIVMTDSDITDCKTKIQVPGGVWFLWRSDELYSKNLYDHLSGAKVTESFSLEDTKGD